MTVLLDSWVWIEYLKSTSNGERVRKYIESEEEKLISPINIAEIYRYLLANKPEKANELITYVLSVSFTILVDVEIALNAAKIKHGKKLGMADAIIYATAKTHDATVVTGDPHFKDLDKVEIIT